MDPDAGPQISSDEAGLSSSSWVAGAAGLVSMAEQVDATCIGAWMVVEWKTTSLEVDGEVFFFSLAKTLSKLAWISVRSTSMTFRTNEGPAIGVERQSWVSVGICEL